MNHHYLALQFSGIQKAILRHGRLWSLSGISQMMQRLNEVELPGIIERSDPKGKVLIAGGGKLTAVFKDKPSDLLKMDLSKCIASRLPMLEYQISVKDADKLRNATDASTRPNLITGLADQKRALRGYGVTYNPHLEVCEECGEYPVTFMDYEGSDQVRWCGICSSAHDAAEKELADMVADKSTSIERVYATYIGAPDSRGKKIPLNFADLVGGEKQSEGKRIAVWMSDTNNMGDIVPLWLAQGDNAIINTLNTVKESNIAIVAEALRDTFPLTEMPSKWLPFRIIIAGGDDLCVVMDEKYILQFAENFAVAHNNAVEKAQTNADHPLNHKWLMQKAEELGKPPDSVKPSCFAGCFVVTSLHTPFYKIHEVGEHLLKQAKEKSGRAANSVTWRIMAEDQEPVAEKLLKDIEKPVFISDKQSGTRISEHLSFAEYRKLRESYSKLSTSHMHMIVARILDNPGNAQKVEQELRILASGQTERSFAPLLRDPHFHGKGGNLATGRLASLFELMSIGG